MNKAKIFEKIERAEALAKLKGVILEINRQSFIDDETLDVNDYANDTELMSMQYQGYLVNVYIGSWDSFKECGKWIDYDIFYNDYELMNENDNICTTNDVLEAATDIEFYINKIENIINRKEV